MNCLLASAVYNIQPERLRIQYFQVLRARLAYTAPLFKRVPQRQATRAASDLYYVEALIKLSDMSRNAGLYSRSKKSQNRLSELHRPNLIEEARLA